MGYISTIQDGVNMLENTTIDLANQISVMDSLP